MKRWAILVVVLYAIILTNLLFVACVAAFSLVPLGFVLPSTWHDTGPLWAIFWSWVILMALAEAALLVVPVRLASARPVKQRHVIWTVAAAVFMLLVMGATLAATVYEFLYHAVGLGGIAGVYLLAIALVAWVLWAALFAFYTGVREPRTRMSRMVRFLLAGSIAELVVAVPAHVYARAKDSCCGGFGTIWGIAAGLSVMLFAFGPGVFVLFVRRYASLRRPEK